MVSIISTSVIWKIEGEKLSLVNRSILLQSLAQTIADYRYSEIPPMTARHIEKWLNQFDPEDQPVILAEMDALMKRFYFSRVRIKECLRNFLRNDLIGSRDPTKVLPQTRFLQVQRQGNSQQALLAITDEILANDYGIRVASCGINHAQIYVYIDDCLYTGSRIRYDLTQGDDAPAWIPKEAPPNCTLIVYNIGVHLFGMNYVYPLIRSAAREKGISFERKYSMLIDNRRTANTNLTFLWPEQIVDDHEVHSYTTELVAFLTAKGWSYDNLYRSAGIPKEEMLFSSSEARRIVERAFLKKGIQLATAGHQRAESIRPLGFEKLGSLGFGTFFITYRNIANNCPLVLWWGNPDLPATHPLGKWYPLFPRSTNSARD